MSNKQTKLDLKTRRHVKQKKKPISTGVHEIGKDTSSQQESKKKKSIIKCK